jgi:hypothetical protein
VVAAVLEAEMTRLAHLAPISIMEETIADQGTHLCVANLILENHKYLEFYHNQLRRGAFVIMDVPAFERVDMTLADLLEAARGLQPSQIILPDDMDDPQRSIRQMREAATAIWKWKWGVNLLAVPHGRTVEEFLQNAEECADIRGVTTLGVQEEIEDDFGIQREDMVRRMHNRFPTMALHFNGFTEGMEELEDSFCQRVVHTADSAKLVVYGIHSLEPRPVEMELPFPEYPGRKSLAETSMGYFEWVPERYFDGEHSLLHVPTVVEHVRNNIRRWNAVAFNGAVID